MTKHSKADLKRNYTLHFQTGLILSLIFILALTKTPMQQASDTGLRPIVYVIDTEIIDIPNTDKIKAAPAKPYVPVEVVNDEPIEDINIEFPDFEFYESPISLPPEQSTETSDDIHDSWGVEVMPIMIGGLKALYAELEYPKMALRAGIEGKVIVQFTVNKLGQIENQKILRGIGGGCDKEVLRVIQLMRFTPGIQNEQTVKVRMTQPVVFRITN